MTTKKDPRGRKAPHGVKKSITLRIRDADRELLTKSGYTPQGFLDKKLEELRNKGE